MSQPVRRSRKGRGATSRSAENYRLRINTIVQKELDDDLALELKAMQDRWNQYLASQQTPVTEDDILESISILFDSFEIQVPVSHQTVEHVRRKVVAEQTTSQFKAIASQHFDEVSPHHSLQSLAYSVASPALPFNIKRCQHGVTVRINSKELAQDHSQCGNISKFLKHRIHHQLNPLKSRFSYKPFVQIHCNLPSYSLEEVQARLCRDKICHVVAIFGTSNHHPVQIGQSSLWKSVPPGVQRLALPIYLVGWTKNSRRRRGVSWSELQFNNWTKQHDHLTPTESALQYGTCHTGIFGEIITIRSGWN